jgi:hypothetical protein
VQWNQIAMLKELRLPSEGRPPPHRPHPLLFAFPLHA